MIDTEYPVYLVLVGVNLVIIEYHSILVPEISFLFNSLIVLLVPESEATFFLSFFFFLPPPNSLTVYSGGYVDLLIGS